ncbi:MAG: 50S ribosomal protein L6 [Verrucomicrobiota bacterium]
MSRIGRKPVIKPEGVTIALKERLLTVEGPKGTLELTVPENVDVREEDNQMIVEIRKETVHLRACHGMTRSILQNMVTGVTDGFRRELEIQGVGYRGKCQGQRLVLNLGLSHPVEFEVPKPLQVTMPSATQIVIEGPDKQMVGQAAATIRSFRPPDPYKGKGIRYVGEQITLKEGKTVG